MVNQQGSPFYAEDATAMQRSHQRIATTFPISKVYQAHIPTFAAGYWLFGFASKKYHPINDLDSNQWNALNMRTRYYTTRLHVGAFCTARRSIPPQATAPAHGSALPPCVTKATASRHTARIRIKI